MTIILNGTTGITTPADTVTTITSPAATDLTIQSAGVTAITVDTAQNVGIGTTLPATKLHLLTPSATLTEVRVGNNQSYASLLIDATGAAQLVTPGSTQIFSVNGAERARIEDAGNFLVNTTTATGQITSVSTSMFKPAGRFYHNVTSGQAQPAMYIDKFDNTNTTSQIFVKFTINATTTGCGQINGNGASQAAFGSFSDVRLKENVVDLPPQLANILALRPVEFDYKTGGHQTGFIAQEIQQIFPDAVGDDGSEDKYLTVTGWNKTESILVKAIQEQQAIITALTARITALETK